MLVESFPRQDRFSSLARAFSLHDPPTAAQRGGSGLSGTSSCTAHPTTWCSSSSSRPTGPRPFSFPNTFQAVRGTVVAELNQAADLNTLFNIAANAVHTLTGFDRVMIYRYDQDFNGEVVAEVKRAVWTRSSAFTTPPRTYPRRPEHFMS